MEFKYKARDKYGRVLTGVTTGSDSNAVARELKTMSYAPISIEEVKRPEVLKIFQFAGKKVKPIELNLFTKQLAVLQKVGVPILVGLSVISKQTSNKYFKEVIEDVSNGIEGGLSLSDALSKYPKIFNNLYINMVKAGEASGLLVDILNRLAEFGERDIDNRSKVKAATRYPLITLIALVIVFFVITTLVIPKFADIFSQGGKALPLPTMIMLGLSGAIKRYWYMIPIVLGLCIYLINMYLKTKAGRLRWDMTKLKLPVMGQLLTMLTMARFSRTMSILIKSGLPILQILEIVSKTVDNAIISKTIHGISESVKNGKGMSGPMQMSGMFPPIVVQMVAIGEESGKMDELLMNVAEYYDRESDYIIKNLTTLIEPIFIVGLGAMVLMILLAVFMPMWDLISVVKG